MIQGFTFNASSHVRPGSQSVRPQSCQASPRSIHGRYQNQQRSAVSSLHLYLASISAMYLSTFATRARSITSASRFLADAGIATDSIA